MLAERARRSLRTPEPGVARDTPASEEDLDGAGGDADLDVLTDEGVRDAVVPAVVVDVVIDVHRRFLPPRQLPPSRRQRLQRRPGDRLEDGATAAFELAEGARVQAFEQLGDRRVEIVEAEEGPVAQPRQDPPLR